MLPELQFELSDRRTPRRVLIVGLALSSASLFAAAVFAWKSHEALNAARAEVAAAQQRSAAVKSATPPPVPPYYEEAMAALRLLQWPFDASLTEMEKCLPGDAQVESIHIDALARRTTATLDWTVPADSGAFDAFMKCLNSATRDSTWRIKSVQRAKATGQTPLTEPPDGVNLVINLERSAR